MLSADAGWASACRHSQARRVIIIGRSHWKKYSEDILVQVGSRPRNCHSSRFLTQIM